MHMENETSPISLQPNKNSQADLRKFIEDWEKCIRAGDIERIMNFYAETFTAFDMMPPLVFNNREEYKKQAWEACFTDYFQFPVIYEHHDLTIHAAGDIAMIHGLSYFQGTPKASTEEYQCWMRQSLELKLIGNQWKIIHEHNSVPSDNDGKARMDLKPEHLN